MNRRSSKVSRRDLLKSAAVAGAGLGLASIQTRAATPAETEASLLAPPPAIADSVMGLKFEPRETVRVAIIGTGSRGTGMLSEFLAVKNVQITALCDVVIQPLFPALCKKRGRWSEMFSAFFPYTYGSSAYPSFPSCV
jgi:hypothetical protein